jgi:hypothetical protein
MQREVSRVKRARLLSQNQIREIVMDSDSDKDKYYASEDTEHGGAIPTFTMVFNFTAPKPRFFCALSGPKLFNGLPHKK